MEQKTIPANKYKNNQVFQLKMIQDQDKIIQI